MSTTEIEWTRGADGTPGKSWNPVTGCTKISPGCKNCYAERMALRLKAMGQPHYTNGFKVTLHDDALDKPLHWKKPRMIFVNSMSDLFHLSVPRTFVEKVFTTMDMASWHTYQILTKRDVEMSDCLHGLEPRLIRRLSRWPLPNVWLGVSIESKEYKRRIDILRTVPAAIRFISFEPLLEDIGEINLEGIHWAIIGGESGPKARPFNIDWARNIIRQCREQKVAVFMKQDSGRFAGRQGRIPNELWLKEYPVCV